MRVRAAVVIAVLALSGALVSCGSDEPTASSTPSPSSRLSPTAPSVPVTEVPVSCKEYEGMAKRIADAQSSLYSGTKSDDAAAAIADVTAAFEELKKDAPADVRAALDDYTDAFAKAAAILENPTQDGAEQLAELAPKLADSGQLISAYILKQCS